MHPTAFKYFVNRILPEITAEMEEISAGQVSHIYNVAMGASQTFLISKPQLGAISKEMDEKFPPDYKYSAGWRISPNPEDVEKALKQSYVMGGWIGDMWEPNSEKKNWVRKGTTPVVSRKISTEPKMITFTARIKFIPKEKA